MLERRFAIPYALDLGLTLGVLTRPLDPTTRLSSREVWRAANTPDGPATLHVAVDARDASALVRAWGSGAGWMIEHAPALLGADDEPELLRSDDSMVARLIDTARGLRLTRAMVVHDVAMAVVIDQRVTGREANRTWRRLIDRYGTAAPEAGRAAPRGLRVPPAPAVVAALGDGERRGLDLELRRGGALCRVAADNSGLQRAAEVDADTLDHRLRSLPGVGEWTSAQVRHVVLGDPDAVAVGDWHLAKLVVHAFSGATNGTDEQMLELLEPFRGQRGRVVRLILSAGPGMPRRAPRAEIPDLLARERSRRPYRVRRTLRFDRP